MHGRCVKAVYTTFLMHVNLSTQISGMCLRGLSAISLTAAVVSLCWLQHDWCEESGSISKVLLRCSLHPAAAQDLQRASTQATEYAMQLLAMMDAAVQAASSGTHVEAILEVHLVTLWAPTLLTVHEREDTRLLHVCYDQQDKSDCGGPRLLWMLAYAVSATTGLLRQGGVHLRPYCQ